MPSPRIKYLRSLTLKLRFKGACSCRWTILLRTGVTFFMYHRITNLVNGIVDIYSCRAQLCGRFIDVSTVKGQERCFHAPACFMFFFRFHFFWCITIPWLLCGNWKGIHTSRRMISICSGIRWCLVLQHVMWTMRVYHMHRMLNTINKTSTNVPLHGQFVTYAHSAIISNTLQVLLRKKHLYRASVYFPFWKLPNTRSTRDYPRNKK